jgi:S1-C subfamily serine protease
MRINRTSIALSLILTFVAFSEAVAQRTSVASRVAEQRLRSTVTVANQTVGKLEVWGAGTIIDDRGYILTCEHVVDDMAAVAVGFHDGQFLPATIVYADEASDVALLKVNGERRFDAVPLSPADLQPGEPLIIIGSPKGFSFTVSAGIVSKLADTQYGPHTFKNAIQTDGAFNGDAELVGMSFLRRTDAEAIAWGNNADFIGLVLARGASAEKIAGVQHGLGLDEELIPGVTGPNRRGLFVRFVKEGARTTVLEGDRITRVSVVTNGVTTNYAIRGRFDFERSLWDTDPGDRVTLTVRRNGQTLYLPLTLTGNGVDRDGR